VIAPRIPGSKVAISITNMYIRFKHTFFFLSPLLLASARILPEDVSIIASVVLSRARSEEFRTRGSRPPTLGRLMPFNYF